jgi:ligand-binding sensor domain-containing protein
MNIKRLLSRLSQSGGVCMVVVLTTACALQPPSRLPDAIRPTSGPTTGIPRPTGLAATPATQTESGHAGQAPARPLAPLELSAAPVQAWTDPNDVNALLLEGEQLWAATGGGVVRWDTRTGEHTLFTVQDGLASQATRGIARDGDGRIWVGYADHETWSAYDGARWESYSSRQAAVEARYEALRTSAHTHPALWSHRPGSQWLWLPTADGRVAAYDGKTWHRFGSAQGATAHIWLVGVAANGRVWAVGDRISTLQEGDLSWETYGYLVDITERDQVRDIAVDGSGGLWVAFTGAGQAEGGLCRLDPDAGRWAAYTHALNPAIPPQVHAVDIDTNGVLWLGGLDTIVMKRPQTPWQSISVEGSNVRCIALDDTERVWLGTGEGIWPQRVSDGERGGHWIIPAPIRGNQVRFVARDAQGRLWVASETAVTSIDAHGHAVLALGAEVRALARSPAGQVWLATRSALYSADQDGSLRMMAPEGATAMAFAEDGALWLCTPQGQLARWSAGQLESVRDLTTLFALPIQGLAVGKDGALWMATPDGVGILAPDGEVNRRRAEDGLPDADVRAIAIGPDGSIWVGTADGLTRRQPNGYWILLTRATTDGGLRSPDIRGLFFDEQGTLWLATSAGVSTRTADAEWAYLDLAGALAICPDADAAWVGALGGLYRLTTQAMTRVP